MIVYLERPIAHLLEETTASRDDAGMDFPLGAIAFDCEVGTFTTAE